MSDPKRELLRHALATIAYRGRKAMAGAPAEFAAYRASETTRTPAEILAHMVDLAEWGLSMAEGQQRWSDSEVLPWDETVERFFAALQAFDDYLASDGELGFPVEKLFQGPIADSLNHIGQLAMLRRIAGAPIKGENYSRAEIEAGRVGADQADPGREFD